MLTPMVGLSYLKRMGIDRMNEPQPAGALGGFAKGMTTVEMAGAFSTFASRGLFTKPYLFTRVLDAEGNVLLEHKPEFDQVFSTETADIMTNLLVDTLKTPAGSVRTQSSGDKKPQGKQVHPMNALTAGSQGIRRTTPQPSGMGLTTPTVDVRKSMKLIRVALF